MVYNFGRPITNVPEILTREVFGFLFKHVIGSDQSEIPDIFQNTHENGRQACCAVTPSTESVV